MVVRSALSCTTRNILNPLFCATRNAGHSHWQNTRHTKAANDQARAIVISQACRDIRRAITNNGMMDDPEVNTELAKVLAACKTKGVPKETIKRTIANAKRSPQAIHYVYIKGPNGIFVVLEGQANQESHLINDTRRWIKKQPGFLVGDHGLRSFFDQRGFVQIAGEHPTAHSENEKKELAARAHIHMPSNLEEAETLGIEVGAEEVQTNYGMDDGLLLYEFLCEPNQPALRTLSQALAEHSCDVVDSFLGFTAKMPIDVTDEAMEQLNALYDVFLRENVMSRCFDNVDRSQTDGDAEGSG